MESPSQLIARAERSRRLRPMQPQRQEEPPLAFDRVARPLPTSHSGYTQLMRSHDRMRTRHLSKNGD